MTIIDGIIACEMFEPKEANLLLMGADTLALDIVASAVIGLDPGGIEYLNLAAQEGLGNADFSKIKIFGLSIDEAKTVLVSAPNKVEAFAKMFPEVKLVDGEACTGCTNNLYRSLKLVKKNGRIKKLEGMTIAIGKNIDKSLVDSETIYLGNCLHEYKNAKYYKKGCPFASMDVNAIIDQLD